MARQAWPSRCGLAGVAYLFIGFVDAPTFYSILVYLIWVGLCLASVEYCRVTDRIPGFYPKGTRVTSAGKRLLRLGTRKIIKFNVVSMTIGSLQAPFLWPNRPIGKIPLHVKVCYVCYSFCSRPSGRATLRCWQPYHARCLSV